MAHLITLLFTLFWSSYLFSFPNMVRHGYTTCNTCHATPYGGDLLTQYGKAMSTEILSTQSYGDEAGAEWSKIGPVSFAAHFRQANVLQVSNPIVIRGKAFIMESAVGATIEACEHFKLTGKVGFNPIGYQAEGQGIYKINDRVSLFAGKIPKTTQLALAHHLDIPRAIGAQPYLLEWAGGLLYQGEYMESRLKVSKLSDSLAVRNVTSLMSRYWRVGAYVSSELEGGVHGLISPWDPIAFLAEAVWKDNFWKWYVEANLEVTKGVHAYVSHQPSKPGIGVAVFPRPHMELRSEIFWGDDLITFLGLLHLYL